MEKFVFYAFIAAILQIFLPLSAAFGQMPEEATSPKFPYEDTYEMRTYLPYRLLKPKQYDPAKKYPLVVFLHGMGERGADNRLQLMHGSGLFANDSAQEKYPCFVVFPQCPSTNYWTMSGEGVLPGPNQAVLGIIAELQKEFSIDADRLYIGGLSMGGFGTWDIITSKPDLFAAAFPVCGGGDPQKANLIATLPIWAFHGAADDTVTPEHSREMIAAIKKAGGSPRYTEYEGVGHDSWTNAFKEPELLPWLFAQKRTPQ